MNVIVTEDQYLEDLAALFRRYRLRTGSPGALENLSDELQRNPGFRGDLFNLCTAISHMRETDLTPEEMLSLAARALAGRSSRSGEDAIPSTLRASFLDEYGRWLTRNESQQLAAFGSVEENSPDLSHPLPLSANRFSSAASLSGTDRRWQERGQVPPRSPAEPAPPASGLNPPQIGPETPIGNLTISQLRVYLDEIESRVGRLQPYLESLRHLPESAPSANAQPDPLPASPRPETLAAAAPPQAVTEPIPSSPTRIEPPLIHRGQVVPPDLPPIRSDRPAAAVEANAAVRPVTEPPAVRQAADAREEVVRGDRPPTEDRTAASPVASSASAPPPSPVALPATELKTPPASTPTETPKAAPVTAPKPGSGGAQQPKPEATGSMPAMPRPAAEKTAHTSDRNMATGRHAESLQRRVLASSKEASAGMPKTYEAEENDPVVLPVRGTFRRSDAAIVPTRAPDLNATPLSAMVRNAPDSLPLFWSTNEPDHSGSGHMLAIIASLVLLATTGAAGFHYFQIVRAPVHPLAPAPLPPSPAPEILSPTQASTQQPSPTATGKQPPSSIPYASGSYAARPAVAAHPVRPASRAIQVEAEAARSEEQANSNATTGVRTTPAPIVRPSQPEPAPTYSPERR